MTFSHLGQQNKKLSKVKLGQVGVCSNIVQNHLHGLKEVICAHYWPQFTWTVDQKCNYVKLESIRKFLRITRPPFRKSYLFIFYPNSHDKLTKCKIRSSWCRFKHCSESLTWPLGSHIRSLVAQIHIESWPKLKLGQVDFHSNTVPIH